MKILSLFVTQDHKTSYKGQFFFQLRFIHQIEIEAESKAE